MIILKITLHCKHCSPNIGNFCGISRALTILLREMSMMKCWSKLPVGIHSSCQQGTMHNCCIISRETCSGKYSTSGPLMFPGLTISSRLIFQDRGLEAIARLQISDVSELHSRFNLSRSKFWRMSIRFASILGTKILVETKKKVLTRPAKIRQNRDPTQPVCPSDPWTTLRTIQIYISLLLYRVARLQCI